MRSRVSFELSLGTARRQSRPDRPRRHGAGVRKGASFGLGASGILRDLVKTRYGFHIVAVDQSIPGKTLPFEAVRGRDRRAAQSLVEERALRQYISVLAGQAEIIGVDLNGASTPLVQ